MFLSLEVISEALTGSCCPQSLSTAPAVCVHSLPEEWLCLNNQTWLSLQDVWLAYRKSIEWQSIKIRQYANYSQIPKPFRSQLWGQAKFPASKYPLLVLKILKLSSWVLSHILNLYSHLTFSPWFWLPCSSLWVAGVGGLSLEELGSGATEWWKFLFSPGDRWQLVSIRAMPFFKFTDGKRFVAAAGYKGQFLPQLLCCHLWTRLLIWGMLQEMEMEMHFICLKLRFVLVQYFSWESPGFSSADLVYEQKKLMFSQQ